MKHILSAFVRQKLVICIIMVLGWSLYIALFCRPVQLRIDAESLNTALFGNIETWIDKTVYRWNKYPEILIQNQVKYQYAFAKVKGMAYETNTQYRVTVSDAASQVLMLQGITQGFRVYRMMFLSRGVPDISNAEFSLTMEPLKKKPVIVGNRVLSVAVAQLAITTRSDIGTIIRETGMFLLSVICVLTLIDYRRYPIASIVINALVLILHVLASIQVWDITMGVSAGVVIGVCVWYFSIYVKEYTRIYRILRFIIIVIVPFVWIVISSYYLITVWEWRVDKVVPMPLILSGIIAWPMLSFMIYKLLHMGRYHPITLRFFGVYVGLSALLFSQMISMCYSMDTLHNLDSVIQGRWHDWYMVTQLVILTSFFQIIPWGLNAPLIFQMLIWVITLTYVHTILYRQRSHWIFHLILPVMILTPIFLISLLKPMHHIMSAVYFLYLLLFVYATVKFQKYRQWTYILGISIIGTIVGMHRVDAMPVVLCIFAFVIWIIVRPEYFRQFGTTLGSTMPQFTQAHKIRLMICLLLPALVLYGYGKLIPHTLMQNQTAYRGNSWDNRRDNFYSLVLMEDALGYILSQPTTIIRPEYREKIARVYHIDELIAKYKTTKPLNVPYFIDHGGGYIMADIPIDAPRSKQFTSTPNMNNEAMVASIGIYADNPLLFLEGRLRLVNWLGFQDNTVICKKHNKPFFSKFLINLYKEAPLTAIHKYIDNYYATIFYKQTNLWRGGLWLNVYFYLLLCLPMIILYRISPIVSCMALLIVLRTCITILVAPQSLFSNYVSLYIGIFFLYALWLPALHKKYHSLLRSR